MRVDPGTIQSAVTDYFAGLGLPLQDAQVVATVMVEAELEGQSGHGLSRLPIYAGWLRAGGLNALPEIRVERTRPAVAIIHADRALGAVAGFQAVDQLMAMCQEMGQATVAVRQAGHIGPLSAYVGRLAQQGLIGLAVANTPPAMAPWGGKSPILGTNPIAFAAPAQPHPLVIDLSLSVAARGTIMAAARQEKSIPAGWALDDEGQPTTRAEAALKGTLLPAGEAKGYALALMVEVLAGILAGPLLSFELEMPWTNPATRTMQGLWLQAFDPAAFNPDFASEMERLGQAVREAGGRLPGERRQELRRRAEAEGLDLPEPLVLDLRKAGVHLPPIHE